ncbi:MAG: lipopolysaccharide heptosyltransferase II [Deltaproteobacteria bacterium]|nr:lipopolysaccharide heptosyltransferase II [Deltaproteobacteria bacterium]
MRSQRILIVRLGAIGDVVNCLPLLNRLKNADPQRYIAWAVEPKAYPILEGHRSIDKIFLFPRKEPWKIPQFIAQIRQQRFDIALDLQRILKSGLITLFSKAPVRLGFDRSRCKEGNGLFTNQKIPSHPHSGVMLEQFLEFADLLKVPPSPVEWKIAIPSEIHSWADKLLAPLSHPRIAIHLGASKPANRWRSERYLELAQRIQKNWGAGILFTGGIEEAEASHKIKNSSNLFLNLVGKTNLKQTAAVLQRCDLVIGGDTGPIHLAVAMGTPVVTLFGAANPQRTGPYGYTSWVVRKDLFCSPCGQRTCPLKTYACLEELRVDDVMGKVQSFLQNVT